MEYVKKDSKIFRKLYVHAKSLYFTRKIKMTDNKIKATWNCVNRETGRVKSRDTHLALKVGENTLTFDKKVAKAFEHYFTDIRILSHYKVTQLFFT